MPDLQGSCNCANVTFRITAPVEKTSACHCGQCRKQSGHYWASGFVAADALEISGNVRWYEASPTAKRGFCPECGCFLFWKAHDENAISFSLGALDGPTDIALKRHIFTADKGDYYEITDGLPQT